VWIAGTFVACGADGSTGSSNDLTGVVVKVQSLGLGNVRSFTLRSEGRNYRIFIGPDAKLAFPPAHLSEHLATAQPVHVRTERRHGDLFALFIEDG
jgi:hypothetical protein